ncbi:ABC transporter substrate-binding protein [Paenibacillus chartarius]|uniref:ABC transporter substrate-binding protein n=1 Tax=Paenibacillus chartarius TaxID=747481 RepID=A0ABV6DQ31_9BACL
MKKRRNAGRGSGVLALIMMLAVWLSGCSGGAPAATKPEPAPAPAPAAGETKQASAELPPVELQYYFAANVQNLKDLPLVEAEMNKIVKAKINATVKLNAIDFAAFDQKMNIKSASGEPYDLVFTAPWKNNYFQNVAKGTLLPLDDLLAKYAPTLKATVPAKIWDATRVNGKIYGAINWQIVAMAYGVSMPKMWVDKYKIDINNIKSLKDVEPYLAKWEEKWPAYHGGENKFTQAPPFFGFDSVGDDASVGWVRLNDKDLKVVNQYESPEFKELIETTYDWRKKGFIPPDAVLYTDEKRLADQKAGKTELLLSINGPAPPGVENAEKQKIGVEIVVKPISKPLITTNRAIATMTGISKTSQNPERAMMFLELINTDKDLYNLLCNGIEGKHYKMVDKTKGLIEKIPDSGYNPSTDWMFGNQFNGYYTSPESVGNWEKTIQMNAEGEVSPLLGFNFNPEPIKSELAQVSSVWKEYSGALMTGSADPQTKYPEFLDKLKKAGADKIIAEKQKQIDEWRKSK